MKLDKNEKIILDVRRHPIGLIGIYIGAGLGISGSLLLLYLSLKFQDTISADIPAWALASLFGGLAFLIAIFSYIGAVIYKTNRLIVTNENIIQTLQFGLFNQQVSQLNLAKIQDVSVDKVGLLQTFVEYGTLEIETAGEASNFKFAYTPNPNKVAKVIIEAHEGFIRHGYKQKHYSSKDL